MIEEQISFMEKILLKVHPILDEINKFEEADARATKLKSLIKITDNARESCPKRIFNWSTIKLSLKLMKLKV